MSKVKVWLKSGRLLEAHTDEIPEPPSYMDPSRETMFHVGDKRYYLDGQQITEEDAARLLAENK